MDINPEVTEMAPDVAEVYVRGLSASYNEANPFTRARGREFYWWQAGFYDCWGELPRASM